MESSSDDTTETKSSNDNSTLSVIEVIDETLHLGENDKRYGFSIMGGVDEGFCPRIEDIAEGKYICVAQIYELEIKN
ncbi:Hypothetical predicted protein [Mytilus galloprovincialis]|uniref:Uncharacterized protein n=1 Tax=Mytilus galloprovincialis TaxID=29158 RepID=A0A8B6D3X7_MYTGA|nr:Hypothetical predicted protein [Mytilus galloprovincialis]